MIVSNEYSSSLDNCYNLSFHEEDEKLLLEARGDVVLIKALMKYGKNSLHKPALYLAVLNQDLEAVEVFLKAGASSSSEMVEIARRFDNKSLEKILQQTGSHKTPLQYSFSMTQKNYLFSTEFELDSDQIAPCQVIKHKISIHTNYVLHSSQGVEATGTVRILSMGTFFAWGKDVDLYDERGGYLGMIDGEALTTTDAKFSFYDKNGDKVAIAYLDQNKSGFTIVHPDKPARVIARLTREFIKDTPDPWKVKVYQGDDVDSRLIKIFAAFAVDTDNLFKEDV